MVLALCSQGRSDPAPVIHYAPAENLEHVDVALIDRAEHEIDMAAYVLTDWPIIQALTRAARRLGKVIENLGWLAIGKLGAVLANRPQGTRPMPAGDPSATTDETAGFPPLRRPKKRGPFQAVPGMARAITERLA